MSRFIGIGIMCAAIAGSPWPDARADEFHYKNVLIGERAAGMGGAFTAISDDPSGVYYNPAGLVFSMENYFSLSANAYSISSQKYEDIVGSQDYTYSSQALVPAFFGFSQSLGKGKLGFAVMVPDSSLVDQEDSLTGLTTEADLPNTFSRKFFKQDTTYLAGPAYSMELRQNLTVGVSLLGLARQFRAIDNQWVIYNAGADGKERYFVQNLTLSGFQLGLQPKLGIQYMPSTKLSLGLTATRLFYVRSIQKVSIRGSRQVTGGDDAGKPVQNTGDYPADMQDQTISTNPASPEVLSFTLGAAYFFSKKLLVSGDFDLHLPDRRAQLTYNWALGTEWYAWDSIALRGGVFSNRSNTKELSSNKADQDPHVNQLGGTFSASLYKTGSSITVGATYSGGTGKGQAIGGATATQDVAESNLTFYFSGSYQL